MKKTIFIGAAWPYANGSLHLGHIASLIGGDILARFYRLRGDNVLYVSGSDCHGTPIAVEADRRKISPSEIAESYHNEFVKTLIDGLRFSYDIYTKTTTKNHYKTVQDIFLKLYSDGYIYPKTEELPYCPRCKRFLPDRYIEGECPDCHFKNARGDQCDECGNLVVPRQLINPHCKVCGGSPEWKPSEHFFLKLSALQDRILAWVSKSGGWRQNAKKFTINILKEGLIDRAITRDSEWGIPIPLSGYEGKCIYVWFEAVCGYLSASKEWAILKERDNLWKKFWETKSAKHFYVHGKDNIPFHTIIWPAILLGYGGLHLPDYIVSSEYLTLGRKQFSKSRNWAVWLPDFLSKFDPETIRFHLVVNGPETSDANFSWEEYRQRINAELIGNFGNFIHRVLSFIRNNFPEGVTFPQELDKKSKKIIDAAKNAFVSVGGAIEGGHFREGLRIVLHLAEDGNKFVDSSSPWENIKSNPKKAKNDLAVAIHIIYALAILVNPYLPTTSERILKFIGADVSNISWSYPPINKLIVNDLQTLFRKIDVSEIKEQIDRLG